MCDCVYQSGKLYFFYQFNYSVTLVLGVLPTLIEWVFFSKGMKRTKQKTKENQTIHHLQLQESYP